MSKLFLATQDDVSTINTNTADAYSSSSTYVLGSYCIYNNVLYKCTTAITVAEDWNASKWIATNIGDEVVSVNSSLSDLFLVVTVNLTTVAQSYQNDRLKTCKKVTLRWSHGANVSRECTIIVAGNTFVSDRINDAQCGGYATWNKTTGTITLNSINGYSGIVAIMMEG